MLTWDLYWNVAGLVQFRSTELLKMSHLCLQVPRFEGTLSWGGACDLALLLRPSWERWSLQDLQPVRLGGTQRPRRSNDSTGCPAGGGFRLGGTDEQSRLPWRSEIQPTKCLFGWSYQSHRLKNSIAPTLILPNLYRISNISSFSLMVLSFQFKTHM